MSDADDVRHASIFKYAGQKSANRNDILSI